MGYFRSIENKRRLGNLYNETKSQYGNGAYFDEDKQRFIRYYPYGRPGYTKFLKRKTNKRVRKDNNLPRYSGYKRCYEYWWTLF